MKTWIVFTQNFWQINYHIYRLGRNDNKEEVHKGGKDWILLAFASWMKDYWNTNNKPCTLLPLVVVVSSADLEVVDDSGSQIPGSLVVEDDSDTQTLESVVEVDPSGSIGPLSVVLGEESKVRSLSRLTFDVTIFDLSYFALLQSKSNLFDGNCYSIFYWMIWEMTLSDGVLKFT